MSQFPALTVAGNALWEKLDEQTLSVAAAAVTFSGIDPLLTFFRLTYWLETTAAATLRLRLNNDSGATYERQYIIADSTTVSGQRLTAQTQIATGENPGANGQASGVVLVAKPVAGEEAQVVMQEGMKVGASIVLELDGGQWNDTGDLIDRIDLFPESGNFAIDTRVLLEGAEPAAA